MKSIAIIGAGLGPDTLTREAESAIRQAELILGAPRLVRALAPPGVQTLFEYVPERVRAAVFSAPARRIAVLVSGDTGFYSAAEGVLNALPDCEVRFLPGISSLAALFSRLKRPWQTAALVSCHGRDANLVDAVRQNGCTFALTGGNAGALMQSLVDAGFGALFVTLGENLYGENERIRTLPIKEFQGIAPDSLSVLLIDNPAPDPRRPSGIPDERFLRGEVPMTKSEVRAVSLSKLHLFPDAVCCDIGAGTGSVTVEMALAACRGRVYAIEQNAEALELIKRNCRAFHLGNVSLLPGSAPAALSGLPRLDAAFIGGTGGKLAAIIDALIKNNPGIRIVINAIALETVNAAVSAFQQHGMEPEIVSLSVSRAKRAGALHMMLAQNPVFIISGGQDAF